MLVATLHNKLRPEEERMEDLLTAQVLGAARYLPPTACWVPLLGAGRTASGAPLRLPPILDEVEARFWPRWSHGDGRVTEPDVVLRWPGALVSVEVKYLSGKSSTAREDREAVTDQLARQLVLAQSIAAAEDRDWGVLYLTADAACPRRSMTSSLAEVHEKRAEDLGEHLAWASWADVRAGFAAWPAMRPGDVRLRDDIVRYLTGLGFGCFEGIRARPPTPTAWTFSSGGLRWPVIPPPPAWRFDRRSPPGVP